MHADEEEEKIQAVRYEEVIIVTIGFLCAKKKQNKQDLRFDQ